MTTFHSSLAPQLERFLAHKRSLGFTYRTEKWLLGELDRMAAVCTLGAVIDEPLVRRFVGDGTRGSRSHRLTLIRQVARFVAVEEPLTFVPPRRFLGVRRPKPVIRVLSRAEVGRFLDACDALKDSAQYPHRRLIHGAALRTLLSTGMRRGELLSLIGSDVNLTIGIITVRRAKFGKSRFVPLSPDTVADLRRYDDEMRTRIPGGGPNTAYFPGPDGQRACRPTGLYLAFREAIAIAGITHGGRGYGPRLHDARHTFAVLRLLAWYEQGADLTAKLPLLATYLGHIGLSTSQVYLHMTLDLVGEVVRRYEARFGHLITEEAAS